MKKIMILLCTVILAFLAVGCSDRAEAAAIPSIIPQKVAVESISEEMTDAVNLAESTYVAGSDETADPSQAVLKETIGREENTPIADAKKGTLAYYAPWGDVVMFYEHYGKGSSLYELGEVISGKELIENLSGTIKITAVDE